jgi:hypothetical protein
MKTIFTLMLPVLVVLTGMAGYTLFTEKTYMASALFIVASHLIAAYWVYIISSKKKVAYS